MRDKVAPIVVGLIMARGFCSKRMLVVTGMNSAILVADRGNIRDMPEEGIKWYHIPRVIPTLFTIPGAALAAGIVGLSEDAGAGVERLMRWLMPKKDKTEAAEAENNHAVKIPVT